MSKELSRSDAFRCENCMYAISLVANNTTQKDFGNWGCRRYPPNPYEFAPEEFKSFITPVNHNWWCGEWRAKK